jgi:hypothetical protein
MTMDQLRTIKASQSDQSHSEFINRIERQRLERECLYSLDLRPYAEEPCKHYSYRGRSLWLNPKAHQLFLEGLESSSGVFTVGLYESILKHFQLNPKDFHPTLDEEDRCNINDTGLIVATTAFKPDQSDNNHAIDLSYYERRVHDRLKASLLICFIWKDKTYTAESRDISQSGLQLRIRAPIEIKIDDIVHVDVTPLAENKLKDPVLDYRVVRTRRLLNDTLIGLQCIEDKAKDDLRVISDNLVEGTLSSLSEKPDPEDALLTAQALLGERFYMRSTSILPFFIFDKLKGQPPLRIIFGNQVNQRFLDVFRTSRGEIDFTTLVTPKRIKLFTRVALHDSMAETLIAVYRTSQHSSPKVVADLECKNHKHWHRLLKRYINQSLFRVFKVVARPARKPVDMRIEDALGTLTGKDNEFASTLLKEAQHLSVAGALIDVTEQIRYSWQNSINFEANSEDQPVICQNDEEPYAPPQLVPAQFIQDNRSEERYLGQIKVEVVIAGLIYHGVTQDISAHGLSVKLDEPYVAFIHHRQASISFPRLQAYSSIRLRNPEIFRNVPAEIVGRSTDAEQVLRFNISDVAKGRQFSDAFSGLLKKRQSQLCKDYSHELVAATSRLYSSIFIESTPTLPIFIYSGMQSDWSFRIGLTNAPTPLIDYFEVADGKFDFNVLATQSRLQWMMRKVTNTGASEITLYLNKVRRNNSQTFMIQSLADFEIADKVTRDRFIQQAIGGDFRCIKLIVSQTKIPPKTEINQSIKRLSQLSQGKAKHLKSEFGKLVAIGDAVDITGLMVETCSTE